MAEASGADPTAVPDPIAVPDGISFGRNWLTPHFKKSTRVQIGWQMWCRHALGTNLNERSAQSKAEAADLQNYCKVTDMKGLCSKLASLTQEVHDEINSQAILRMVYPSQIKACQYVVASCGVDVKRMNEVLQANVEDTPAE